MPKPGSGGGGGGSGDGTILIKGGRGDDLLFLPTDRTIVNTYFDGGRGNDTLVLSDHADGVTVTLNNGAGSESIVSTDDFVGTTWSFTTYDALSNRLDGSIKNVENIIGTGGNDRLLVRDYRANLLDGGAGNDSLTVVSGGGDTLVGGSGQDWLIGYGAGNILVGGEWSSPGTLPSGDDETDIFSLTQGTILDFEVDLDKIMIETDSYAAMDAILAAEWTPGSWVDASGASHAAAQLQVADGHVITLVGVDAAVANANITMGFVIGTFGTAPVHGGPGEDILYGSNSADTFVIGPDAGHDMLVHLDTSQDVLSFTGEAPTADDWVDVTVNGEAAIQWTYDSGASSITILGFTTADVAALPIESGTTSTQHSYSFDGLLV